MTSRWRSVIGCVTVCVPPVSAVGEIAMTVQLAPATRPRRGLSRYLAPILIAMAAVAVIVVVVSAPDHSGRQAGTAVARHATARRPPPYWIARATR